MKKRTLALLMAAAMVFTMTACGNTEEPAPEPSTPDPAPSTAEPAPAPSDADGFYVTVKGAGG